MLSIQKIIQEAALLGYTFSVEDAQCVIDSKPDWDKTTETEAEAVADFINAYGA